MKECPDNSEPQCCGTPQSSNFCYEFWERVAIDKDEKHLTLADELAAEEQAKRQTYALICSKCPNRK